MTKISATIVADSKNKFGNRLTTFVLTFPRYILAEFNTHRMLSRNSASSRAIPFAKMLASVQSNPFIPIAWMKDHKGMQGTDYFTDEEAAPILEDWLAARDSAVASAVSLGNKNLTKQIVNRILEPFMWHTVIVTASEWQNFFALRASEFADIHIQKLAYEMLEAYNNSEPKELNDGEWHVPFGDKIDEAKLWELVNSWEEDRPNEPKDIYFGTNEKGFNEAKLKIASARCARISYTVVGEEGKPDNYENDIKLHDRLSGSGHWSPMEHCGRAMDEKQFNFLSSFNADDGEDGTWGWSGNFRGFIQYRKLFAGENKMDDRVLEK